MEYKTEKSILTAPSRNRIMNYEYFMIFELLDTGERVRFNITEDEFRRNMGAGILHPKQVAIIVKEDFRRIFIWKGSAPHVRKKFIASRVAQELQQEMVQIGHLHRCKVVTVEQGDETDEFLRVFGFNLEELAKATGFTGEVLPDVPKITKQPPTTSPIIEKKILTSKPRINIKKTSPIKTPEESKLENKLPKETLDKILNLELPKNFKRKNILTGKNILYGLITKKIEVFGKSIEEKAWEPITNLPKDVFELDGHKLRIHYNNRLNTIEAIEILEPILEFKKEKVSILDEKIDGMSDYNKWTVKQLKAYCRQNGIKVPSSYRKAQIVQLVKDHSV